VIDRLSKVMLCFTSTLCWNALFYNVCLRFLCFIIMFARRCNVPINRIKRMLYQLPLYVIHSRFIPFMITSSLLLACYISITKGELLKLHNAVINAPENLTVSRQKASRASQRAKDKFINSRQSKSIT